MKKIFQILLFLPTVAVAADLNEVIRNVAATRISVTSFIYGKNADVIYVEPDKLCEAVSIMWPNQRIENFRVCNGDVIPRNTVSPAVEDELIHSVLPSVVNNAIRYGQSRQNESGYTFFARSLNAVSHDCKTIEVIVSYQSDLVDRGIREVCDK